MTPTPFKICEGFATALLFGAGAYSGAFWFLVALCVYFVYLGVPEMRFRPTKLEEPKHNPLSRKVQ